MELPGSPRSVSDEGWEIFYPRDIHYWTQAVTLLEVIDRETDENHYHIQFDWRPLVRRLKHNFKVHKLLEEAGGPKWEILELFQMGKVKIPYRLKSSPPISRQNNPADQVVASAMHDIFLIMNLANPGSCDFDRVKFRRRGNERPSYHQVSLSEIQFDISCLNGLEGAWPSPTTLPLKDVVAWFSQIRSGLNQVPQNRIEKVLFALLHIANQELSATTVIWLFHSLETLLDTKPGENFRVLVDRIRLLLEPSEPELKVLNKKMRALYDLRSAFVHGGLEVSHPLHNEMLDKRVSVLYERLDTTCAFGFAVLLSTLQKIIGQGWSTFGFKESVIVAS
jgi:hypothetical protein